MNSLFSLVIDLAAGDTSVGSTPIRGEREIPGDQAAFLACGGNPDTSAGRCSRIPRRAPGSYLQERNRVKAERSWVDGACGLSHVFRRISVSDVASQALGHPTFKSTRAVRLVPNSGIHLFPCRIDRMLAARCF
jgi:hypothetical protein